MNTVKVTQKQVRFENWASLMDKVYKANDNGKWAVIYSVMCAHRDQVFEANRRFTSLFLSGPTSSGKTQIGLSIRELFTPTKNLLLMSKEQLFCQMSYHIEAPILLDEYHDYSIGDLKFQVLKLTIYDGRIKRSRESSRDMITEECSTPVIIAGQDIPERDDNYLIKQAVICELPKPQNGYTKEETKLYKELKALEVGDKYSLTDALSDIYSIRHLVLKYFSQAYRECRFDLVNYLDIDEDDDEKLRVIDTVSLFLAMCKLIEDCTELKLPFTYNEFLEIAIKKAVWQIELITRNK